MRQEQKRSGGSRANTVPDIDTNENFRERSAFSRFQLHTFSSDLQELRPHEPGCRSRATSNENSYTGLCHGITTTRLLPEVLWRAVIWGLAGRPVTRTTTTTTAAARGIRSTYQRAGI